MRFDENGRGSVNWRCRPLQPSHRQWRLPAGRLVAPRGRGPAAGGSRARRAPPN